MITKISFLAVMIPAALTPFVTGGILLAETAMPFDIFENDRLIAFCLIGSGIGALLSVALFMPPEDSLHKRFIRRILIKFGSSMLSGACITPVALERFGTKFGLAPGEVPTPAVTLAAAAAIAAGGVWIIHILTPIIERRAVAMIKTVLPEPKDKDP